MTKEQQRIALAEWMGWKRNSSLDYCCIEMTSYSPNYGKDVKRVMYSHANGRVECEECLPDYPENLNAMHEAEKKLYGIEKWLVYEANLYKLNLSPIAATASQRSEALCRTLWPERFE